MPTPGEINVLHCGISLNFEQMPSSVELFDILSACSGRKFIKKINKISMRETENKTNATSRSMNLSRHYFVLNFIEQW